VDDGRRHANLTAVAREQRRLRRLDYWSGFAQAEDAIKQRTEDAYCDWVRRFCCFISVGILDMVTGVAASRTSPTVKKRQRVHPESALHALLFLYRHVSPILGGGRYYAPQARSAAADSAFIQRIRIILARMRGVPRLCATSFGSD